MTRPRALRGLSALLLLWLSSVVPARASGPGTSAATFLELGFGARPLGLGEAYVAVADDVSALHYNPAGLAYAPSLSLGPEARPYELLFSHSVHIQDIALSQFGMVRRPFGISVVSLRVPDIERRTSETALPEGKFGASDLAVGLSYGVKVADIGVGGTLKFIRQTIGSDSASAYAVDIGGLHRFEGTPLSIGLGVANLGTKVRFVEQEAPLPLAVRAGVAFGMTRRMPHALSLQVDVPRDSAPVIRLGMEYLAFGPFALRLGYRTFSGEQRGAVLGKALGSEASGLSEFYGMFIGVGFRSKLGNMDYSILPYGELGQAHRLSLSLRFGPARGG